MHCSMTSPKQLIEISIKQTTHICTFKTIKEAYLRTAAIPNTHSRHSTITKNLQKYTEWKEQLIILELKRPIWYLQYCSTNRTVYILFMGLRNKVLPLLT